MSLPQDYVERVYAGVLGKLIGVYLGRPFEGWTYERITAQLGDITGYVNERMNKPLVVTDDDISGTFTFLRALQDYDYNRDLTPAQIGQTWLNYLIERKTTLWWGGMGNSTEHTAYLRLKAGIEAPASGSIGLNGRITAEQIGAQIFIDGWAMVAPGDPEFAADLARRAASVSHDGEAIYGAQVLAAMEAQAFVESDINTLIETGLRFIPADSIIARLISDLREWHAGEPDWRKTRERIAANYGYDKYPGVCHMVPNHALILFALLYGGGDFHRSLMIANTSGWDTDCNSGNVGCLLGLRGGLAALAGGPDWRGPIADRALLSTADGARSITDAVTETYQVVNAGRALQNLPPLAPKGGAKFHFELSGSVQGFSAGGGLTLENVVGHSASGSRSLALHVGGGQSVAATTPTFEVTDASAPMPYDLVQSPTLYAGQIVRASLQADAVVSARLIVRTFGLGDAPLTLGSEAQTLQPGGAPSLTWTVPDTHGAPIAAVGVELTALEATTVYLDFLTWDGAPNVTLSRVEGGQQWHRAWVDAVDQFGFWWQEPYRLSQNHGRGLLIQGAREWADYEVSVQMTPHLLAAAGLAARVQGLQRYYALLFCDDGTVTLVKARDGEKELSRAAFRWHEEQPYTLRLHVSGARIRASVDGQVLFDFEDTDRPLLTGAIALVCEEGTVSADAVTVSPPEGIRP